MKRCPNCGQEAVRTEDWSCRWCGYPLMSRSYKKIDKTFSELREERLPPQPVVEKLDAETRLEPELVPDAEVKVVAEPELESEPVPEPEPVLEPKPRARRKPAARRKSTAKSKTTAEAKSPKSTTKPKTAARTRTAPKVKTEPEPKGIEITVDELLSAYESEGEAADARFANQILKITGLINRIEVNDALDICYITLNSAEEGRLLQGVRCVFDRKYGPELNQLTTGQTVTVEGKYDGSIIDLSLRDCVLIS